MNKIYLLGAGKFAEEVADTISVLADYKLYGFIEGENPDKTMHPINNLPVIWIDDIAGIKDQYFGLCAVGSTKRQVFIHQAALNGLKFLNIIHPDAQLSASVHYGKGVYINSGAIIAAHTNIGDHVIINRGVLIGHHTTINSYVTISPGANIAGKVSISSQAFIGMGSIIIDGLSIGKRSIVGAGAVVTKDVPDNVMVMGIPAKIVKQL